MKSNFMKVAFAIAIVMLGGTNVYNAHKCETLSDVALANVEALADDESNKMDFWCCGNTGECAVGDNIVIHCKLSLKPCE